ncbi:MAG: hypothetical protein K6T51_05455 [Rubrobacteraceae bacterium]|nr:DUF3533 domain-containing protein [Rubrobacteraceae bacterium]MCL6438032.1 hypothetical protein [Rubrobacteraceae bacterium]
MREKIRYSRVWVLRSPARFTVLLGVGVFVLQMLFIWSYVGALHAPKPHEVPVAVVGSQGAVVRFERVVEGAVGNDLKLERKRGVSEARGAIDDREVYGAVVLGRGGDRLLVADAASPIVSRMLREEFSGIERSQGRTLSVKDVKPLPGGDSRGLSSFYAVVGWVVGGYLLATAVAILRGRNVEGWRAALGRVGGFAAYAVAAGAIGAVLLEGVIGALGGPGADLAAIGALVVFATAVAAAALQALLGIAGTGIAILLFVVLGNPSSGGPYAPELLPQPWRALGILLPPGAGTTLVRNTVYFGGSHIAGALAVLAAYAMVGSVVILLAGERARRRGGSTEGSRSGREERLLAAFFLEYLALYVEGNAGGSPALVGAVARLVPEVEGETEMARARRAASEVLRPMAARVLASLVETSTSSGVRRW